MYLYERQMKYVRRRNSAMGNLGFSLSPFVLTSNYNPNVELLNLKKILSTLIRSSYVVPAEQKGAILAEVGQTNDINLLISSLHFYYFWEVDALDIAIKSLASGQGVIRRLSKRQAALLHNRLLRAYLPPKARSGNYLDVLKNLLKKVIKTSQILRREHKQAPMQQVDQLTDIAEVKKQLVFMMQQEVQMIEKNLPMIRQRATNHKFSTPARVQKFMQGYTNRLNLLRELIVKYQQHG